MLRLTFILPFVALFQIAALKNVFEFSMEKELENMFGSEDKGKLTQFSWSDCSTSAPIVNVKSLSISPDPLSFPGPLTVQTDFTLKSDIKAPLKAELEVWKKELGIDIRIPCIDNFGSCTYDDVCEMLAPIKSQCPDPVKKAGINCSCPVKQGPYSLPKSEFNIQAAVVPSGEYRVKAQLTQNGAEAVCLDIHFSIA